MSTASDPDYSPVSHDQDLGRLAVLPPGMEMTQESWMAVHEEVQNILALLDNPVRSQLGEVRVQASRTNGKRFLLFSYRTFSTSDSTIDPVVVGITFSLTDDVVAIEADVSGEQTGDLIFSLPKMTVPLLWENLLDAVRNLGQQLCQCGDQLVKALRDSTRRVD